jgi:hypothetical protein
MVFIPYVFNQAGEQFVLAAEIIVDQKFGHPGFACRLQGGGGVKALGGTKAGGSFLNHLASLWGRTKVER